MLFCDQQGTLVYSTDSVNNHRERATVVEDAATVCSENQIGFKRQRDMDVARPQAPLHGNYGQTTGNPFRVTLYEIVQKQSKTVACVLDIFSSAIMDDLLMTFTFRLKVDAKCVYQL